MAQVITRSGGIGPLNLLLSNSGAQWATLLGMGAYIYNPETFISNIRNILLGNTDALLLSSSGQNNRETTTSSSSPTPIIIHTSSSDARSGTFGTSILSTILFYSMGAGCVWISYTICTSLLPATISEMMPVTKKVFDRTTKNLATSLFHIKEAMIQQIQFVMKKQEEFSLKQDETHRDVKDIQDDMKCVRIDISHVMDGITKCENSVVDSQKLQAYTARGVKLLVAAVATVLPRDENYQILRELEKYAHDGEIFRQSIMISSSSSQQQQLPSPTVSGVVLPSPPLVQNNVPPENEHPRQQQQQQHSYSSIYNQLPPPTQRHTQSNYPPTTDMPKSHEFSNTTFCNNNNNAEIDFLAMIRDGTLVVAQR